MAKNYLEPAIFLQSLFVFRQATFYGVGSSYLVAFFACTIGVVGFIYSSVKHLEQNGHDTEKFCLVCGVFGTVLFGNAAVVNGSSFLGFITVACFFSALGFTIIPFAVGICLGFDSDGAVGRCSATSLVMLLLAVVGKHEAMYIRQLKPFELGTYVFGTFVLFLALLVQCFTWKEKHYWGHQARFLIALLAFYSIGSIYNVPAVINVVTIFGFIYALIKYGELISMCSPLLFHLLLFLGGAFLCSSGFYLHTHPEIVMKLFDVIA